MNKLGKCCRKNNVHECIICLQSKKIHLECKTCFNCKICQDCMIPLTNCSLHNKCPLCRSTDWKDIRKSRSQVFPSQINLNLTPRINSIYEKPPLRNMSCSCTRETYNNFMFTLRIAWTVSLILFLCYMLGLLLLLMTIEGKQESVSPLIFALVPLPVGLLVVSLTCCCCCNSQCCIDTKRALCERDH